MAPLPGPACITAVAALLAFTAFGAAAEPDVRRVLIASSPGPDLTYSAGDRISMTVQFDERVDVAGVPVLAIGIGNATRHAPMWMHSGSRLHFAYTVDAADQDANGISVDAGALRLNGGRIVAGDVAAEISLAGHAIDHAAGHKVDGAGTRAPQVVGVSITSDPGPDRTYAIGDEVEVTVEFDEGVTVEESPSGPSVALRLGDERRVAVYREGSGTSRLRFVYKVAAGDVADDGIALSTNGLRGAEALRDGDGNPPATSYAGVKKQPRHMVDGVAPKVTGVEIISTPPASGVYGEGDAVLIEVTFDDAVHWVDEWQWLWHSVGGRSATARATKATATSIVFRSMVEPEHVGESVRIGGIGRLYGRWPGIRDSSGNPADTSFGGAPLTVAAAVDGSIADTTPPAIHDVSIVSLPRDGTTYRLGESIRVLVAFTEPLHIAPVEGDEDSGRYRRTGIEMRIGERNEQADSTVWDRATTKGFHHRIAPSDLAPDGFSVSVALELGEGVTDAAGNAVEGGLLAFDQIVRSEHGVDGELRDEHKPRFESAAPFAWAPSAGVRASQRVGLYLHFDGVVEVLGVPKFVVGAVEREPRVHSFRERLGVTRSRIRFEYVVVENDLDVDGFSVPADAWRAVSFRDQWGNPIPVDVAELAVADFGPPITGKSVDEPAAVAGVEFSTPDSVGTVFAEGETVRVVVAFDNPVNVDQRIQLRLGGHELPCQLDNARFRLLCERVVDAGEAATGIRLAARSLRPSGAATDDAGNVVDLDLSAFVDDIAPLSIDGTAPAITRVVITSKPVAGNTYGAGARIELTVRFSEPVRVTGSPSLALSIGDEVRHASLEGTAGASALRFRYSVSSDDLDASGLAIAADSVELNGGAITDLAGNPAVLSHEALRDRPLHQVDGSVRDDSATPVQIWIAKEPGVALGSPAKEAAASLTWEMRSTWADQPPAHYRVSSGHPGVRIGRESGRVALGESVTNSLALPCPSGGIANTRLTISVEGSTALAVWDVLCRDGTIHVGDVEFFQGPLAARWGRFGVRGFVDAVADRRGLLRLRVEHEGLAVPEMAVSVRGPEAQDIEAKFLGTRTDEGERVSTYLAHLPAAAVSDHAGFVTVVDPLDWLDADIETGGEMAFRALSLESLPVFRPVFVPIAVSGSAPDMSDLQAMLVEALGMLPIGEVDEPRLRRTLDYAPGAEDDPEMRTLDGTRLFAEMVKVWNEEADDDEFYVGVLTPEWFVWDSLLKVRHQGGWAVAPRASINVGTEWVAATIAHELGHNLGLPHAPCGDPPGVDPDFPYDDGGIGPHGGWSFHEGRFVAPDDGYFDLMSYCKPAYISDYNYDKAMGWGDRVREALARNAWGTVRASPSGSAGGAQSPLDMSPSQPRSWALSGSVDEHGVWSLHSAAPSTRPARNDVPGEFTIALFDDAGVEVYRQSLAVTEVSHSTMHTWAVRVPIQAREVRAARIRNAGGGLLLDATVDLPGRGGDTPQPIR